MKRFLKEIALLSVLIFSMMIVLDIVYTKIYALSPPRNKYQMVKKLQGQQVDYVFIGSSRVESHIIPSLITEKTGKTAYNFGFKGTKLLDIATILKMLKQYDIRAKKVFIQIDYNFDKAGRSVDLPGEMAPFIHDNAVTRQYYAGQPNYFGFNYVPFYRYCDYEYKIGFRELMLNIAAKKTDITATNGYFPLFGNQLGTSFELPAEIQDRNPELEAIRKYCKDNKIDVVFFCAPFWTGTKNIGYIDKLKEKIPDLADYSRAIPGDSMFINKNHLNDKGAHVFTQMIIDDLLLKK
jgi:hypothetical protein